MDLRSADVESRHVVEVALFLLGSAALAVADWSTVAGQDAIAPVVVVITALWTAGWAVLVLKDRQIRRQRLEHARTQRMLHVITEARRQILADEDPRRAIVFAAREVTGARLAVLSEPRGDSLEMTATAGPELPALRLPFDEASIAGSVYHSGQPALVEDIHREPGASASALAELEALMGAEVHSTTFVPVVYQGVTLAVLSVAFGTVDLPRAEAATPSLRLLAPEIALAIDRSRLVAQLEAQTRTDALTGIPNLRAWSAAVDRMSRLAAMAIIDLDHFKSVNDTHGHAAGDEVLRGFADLLASSVRAGDTVARVGGEEFGVLVTRASDLEPLLSRLRAEWRPTRHHGTTFSAGTAARCRRETVSALRNRADRALYDAKESGRDQTSQAACVCDPPSHHPDAG